MRWVRSALKMASTQGLQRTERTQFNIPILQPVHHFTNDTWTPVACPSTPSAKATSTADNPNPKIRLITWNIDFGAPAPQERMARALEYLGQRTALADKHGADKHGDLPYVILLQEMTEPDLEQIQKAGWVRERFLITDVSDRFWGGLYGTTTLVDRRLSVQRVFRVLYSASRMQRDGLFVDIGVGDISTPPRRPKQLRLVSQYLHTSGSADLPTPHAGVVAGDMNAFAPEDRSLPAENDFLDAFEALGGKEDSDEAYTWGTQVPDHIRQKFGCSRMDKVLFCGRIAALGLKKFAEGLRAWVEYPEDSHDGDMVDDEKGEEVWVTDHIGLEAVLKVA